MQQQEEELVSKYIPNNIVKSQRVLGFQKRNIADGIVSAVIVGLLIKLIPFVTRVQIIVTVGVCGALFVLCLFGIKGMSISEYLINVFISMATRHKYHLRSIRYVKKNSSSSKFGQNTKVLNESIAEKGVRIARQFIIEQRKKFTANK